MEAAQVQSHSRMNNLDQFVAWLNDAHAMEIALTKVLERHASDAKDFPEIRARIEKHISETRWHVEVVRECLSIVGHKPSLTKSAMGRVTGQVQGAATGVFRDELVKNFLSDYAAEHMEIACYRSLIAAANELNQPEIVRLCEEILQDEVEMAGWLADHIPEITRLSLHPVAAGR